MLFIYLFIYFAKVNKKENRCKNIQRLGTSTHKTYHIVKFEKVLKAEQFALSTFSNQNAALVTQVVSYEQSIKS